MSQVPKNVFSSPPLTNHRKNSTHESAMARWFALTNEPPGKQWLMGEGKKLRSSILWPPLPSAGSKAREDEIWGQVKYHGMLRQHADNSCPERCSGTATCCFCLMMIFFTVWDIGKHNGVQGSWSRLNSCKARPHLEGLLAFSVPHLSLRNEKCNILHLSHVSDRKRNVHVRAWNKTLYIAVLHQKNV